VDSSIHRSIPKGRTSNASRELLRYLSRFKSKYFWGRMPRICQIYLTSRLALQVSFGLPLGILRYTRSLVLSTRQNSPQLAKHAPPISTQFNRVHIRSFPVKHSQLNVLSTPNAISASRPPYTVISLKRFSLILVCCTICAQSAALISFTHQDPFPQVRTRYIIPRKFTDCNCSFLPIGVAR
jgi:hypothetical protein